MTGYWSAFFEISFNLFAVWRGLPQIIGRKANIEIITEPFGCMICLCQWTECPNQAGSFIIESYDSSLSASRHIPRVIFRPGEAFRKLSIRQNDLDIFPIRVSFSSQYPLLYILHNNTFLPALAYCFRFKRKLNNPVQNLS